MQTVLWQWHNTVVVLYVTLFIMLLCVISVISWYGGIQWQP